MRTLAPPRGLTALLALCTVALGTAIAVLPASPAAAVTAVPHGVPARPAAPTAPDPSLQVHALTSAPGPLDNPLKGFATYYFPGSDENSGYPHSLQWSYFGLSEVMTDPTNCNSYNWCIVDNALNEIASYGNQAAIRFYIEYPGGTGTHPGNAIPHCFDGNVTYRNNTYWGTTSPDYDSPFLLNALGNFIAAYGARYDGDPRIGFINLGLVGLWGEWHTWPFDTDTTSDSLPELHADRRARGADHPGLRRTRSTRPRSRCATRPPAVARRTTSTSATTTTRSATAKAARWPASPCRSHSAAPPTPNCSSTSTRAPRTSGSPTRWAVRCARRSSRRRSTSWPGGSGQVDNMKACIELEHTTWKINQTSQSYSAHRSQRRRRGAADGLRPQCHERLLQEHRQWYDQHRRPDDQRRRGTVLLPVDGHARAQEQQPAPSSRPGTPRGTCAPSCR